MSLSWVLALTQVPLFASMFYKNNKKKKSNKPAKDHFDTPFYRFSRKILEYGMHHRTGMLAVSFAILGVVLLGMKNVDKTFFPDFNYNQFYIEHTLPKGSTPKMVNENLRKITDHFNTYNEVEMVVNLVIFVRVKI